MCDWKKRNLIKLLILFNIQYLTLMKHHRPATAKNNILNAKTQTYREYPSNICRNIKQSEQRAASHSSLHNLADKLYSKSSNKNFTTMGSSRISRPSSAGKHSTMSRSELNPEMMKSSIMSGLSMRASFVPEFAVV